MFYKFWLTFLSGVYSSAEFIEHTPNIASTPPYQSAKGMRREAVTGEPSEGEALAVM